MRFTFIAAEKARHQVTRLCRCLGVTSSGFYAWTKRGLSTRAQRDVVLRTKLRAFHAAGEGGTNHVDKPRPLAGEGGFVFGGEPRLVVGLRQVLLQRGAHLPSCI